MGLSILALLCLGVYAAGAPPGTPIAHSPPASGRFIGSPSLARLTASRYVASHDWFESGAQAEGVTAVYASNDAGQTWRHAADVNGQFWSTLFTHAGALYLMGTSGPNGAVAIRRSTDGGRTWTAPRDRATGLLLSTGRYHTAPVPVVVHAGRVWRAMEDIAGHGTWPATFRAFVMSARAGSNLLDAENWVCSNRLAFDPAWLPGEQPGWLEGNVVVTPQDGLDNILRVNTVPAFGRAAAATVSTSGKQLSFQPETGFIPFPGGMSKFTIRHDPVSRRYWALVNKVTTGNAHQRSVLALSSSADLRLWRAETVILEHADEEKVGFQYADWQFDGEDIIAVCRTAFDDAPNFHDANYLTFHRVKGFRGL
ncbi:MAG: exo-alpha-sialidase [Kiritimatiellae bacterium]|nr:exo-alpha-sialidase [Kiritimatiellia bacterium]